MTPKTTVAWDCAAGSGQATLANGGLFVTGATGAIMRLNALTGEIVWKKDLTTVAGRKMPMWGFAASPLITGRLAMPPNNGIAARHLPVFRAAKE